MTCGSCIGSLRPPRRPNQTYPGGRDPRRDPEADQSARRDHALSLRDESGADGLVEGGPAGARSAEGRQLAQGWYRGGYTWTGRHRPGSVKAGGTASLLKDVEKEKDLG
jgi:hypothetical protein